MRYTARDGRVPSSSAPSAGKRLFSAKQDFPDAWQAFVETPAQGLVLSFAPGLFARPQSKKTVKMTKVRFYTKKADGTAVSSGTLAVTAPAAWTLLSVPAQGALKGWEVDLPDGGVSPDPWTVSAPTDPQGDLADLWIIIEYTAS